MLALAAGLLTAGCDRAPSASGAAAPPGPAPVPQALGGAQPPATSAPAAAAPASAPIQGPARGAPGEPADLVHAPIATFAQRCSRCHGPQGAFYAPTFRTLGREALAAKVAEMMRGPGGLKPSAAEVAAMTAHHHALQQKRPFVCVTNAAAFLAGREDTLRGEVSEGATLAVVAGGRPLAVEVSGGKFAVAQCSREPLTITAEQGTAQTPLEFPRASWPQ